MQKPKLFFDKKRRLTLLLLVSPAFAWSQQVSGRVTADGQQPIAGALVKVQAKGGIQTLVSSTGSDGSFSVSGISTDEALLTVENNGQMLFRAIVSTKLPEPISISLPKPFHLSGWQPSEMTADPDKGVLVLDTNGAVSSIRNDASGSHQVPLFKLPATYSGSSIAATDGFVFVTSNSSVGCTLFRFAIVKRSIDRKLLTTAQGCAGVAVTGNSINVVLATSGEIARWDNWDSKLPSKIDAPGATPSAASSPGPLFFDKAGQRLIVGNTDGHVYAVPLPVVRGHGVQLTAEAGWVGSLTANADHVVIASGKKILMLSRSNNQGENPPPVLSSLTGGIIAGVAFDTAGNLWYADYTNGTVSGPLTLK